MKTGPKPPDWEVFAGTVKRVTYQNAENGFGVIPAKVRGRCELVTVAIAIAIRRVLSRRWSELHECLIT
jgi:hypothetical protein